MGLVRLLLIVAAAWLVYQLLRRLGRPRGSVPAAAPPRHGHMVPCLHCGVHVPADRAVVEGEAHFCCEDHRRVHGSDGA